LTIYTYDRTVFDVQPAIEDPDSSLHNRERVSFDVDGTRCVAWHYRGRNGACVVMAGGLAMPKEPGTDMFAARFHQAGYSVFAFDYRYLGESAGKPRGVVRVRDQIADWHCAVGVAAALPEVDENRVVLWGFSLSGGHVIRVAANNTRVAAVVAQTPNVDGAAAARNAARHQRPGALLRFTARSLGDSLRGMFGRDPWMVPLAGAPGSVAVLTTPDAVDSDRALNPGNRYPLWHQTVAARSALPLGRYRPARDVANVRCPLLVVVCDADQSALAEPAVRAEKNAPNSELARMPGGHYEPFLDGHEHAIATQLDFLERQLATHAQPAAS
jgi:uncharacterized protein